MRALTILAAEGGDEGFHAPGLALFHWEPLFHIGPVGVTKPMLMALLVSAVVAGFFWAAFAKPAVVPRGVQNVGELGYMFVRDQIARPFLGKNGDRWMPLLLSLFFFIWIMNLMSVIPVAQFPVTSRIAFPAALAVMIWLLMLGLGMRRQGVLGYFRNMIMPGLPLAIYPLLVPIEYASNILVRPFTHAVRLFANMFAGHLLIALFSAAGWYFLVENLGPFFFVGILGFVLTIVMTAFEMFIQGLQAFIFTLLAAFYISTSLEADH